jgi:hypothetical protein
MPHDPLHPSLPTMHTCLPPPAHLVYLDDRRVELVLPVRGIDLLSSSLQRGSDNIQNESMHGKRGCQSAGNLHLDGTINCPAPPPPLPAPPHLERISQPVALHVLRALVPHHHAPTVPRRRPHQHQGFPPPARLEVLVLEEGGQALEGHGLLLRARGSVGEACAEVGRRDAVCGEVGRRDTACVKVMRRDRKRAWGGGEEGYSVCGGGRMDTGCVDV